MTTVRSLRRCRLRGQRVAGMLQGTALLGVALVAAATAHADGPVHWRHAGAMPPGAIGRLRLLRGGPLSGYCQPVEICAPPGAQIAAASGPGFGDPHADRLLVGLAVGWVYRFRVTEIPDLPGVEVFPTIEMVDRTYPPPGESLKFPVPVELTREELVMASEGKFVTRVIYIEDPKLALPVAQKSACDTRWFDVRPGEDPLIAADSLGRPIAILRLGGRTPDDSGPDCAFVNTAPPPMIYDRPAAPANDAPQGSPRAGALWREPPVAR